MQIAHTAGMIIAMLPLFMSIHPGNAANNTRIPSEIIHQPIEDAAAGRDMTIQAKLSAIDVHVSSFRVYYRTDQEKKYRQLDLQEEVDFFVAVIPGSELNASSLDYFLLALFDSNKVLTHPTQNPFHKPHVVHLSRSSASNIAENDLTDSRDLTFHNTLESAISTLILSPESESKMNDKDIVIAVSFLIERGGIDVNSVQLFLDRQNITDGAEITPFLISYTPENISEGKHKVKLLLKDRNGQALYPVEWNFWIADDNKIKRKAANQQPHKNELTLEEHYQNALNKFYFRDYQNSMMEFATLIKNNPDHPLASNFVYWIGECLYGLCNYQLAIESFEKVHDYKLSQKFDDALIMAGLCYKKLGDSEMADQLFKALLSKFPDSEYSGIVKKYLKEY